jgi:hypothetical protein
VFLSRILLAIHWALPPLAALAMYFLAGAHWAVVLAVAAACILWRPIHTGPILRSAVIVIALSPAAAALVQPFVWGEALVSSTWASIGTLPSIFLRFPSYAAFAVVVFVGIVIAQTLLAALVQPIFAVIEGESRARQRHRDRSAADIERAVRGGGRRAFSLYLRPFKTTGALDSNLIGNVAGAGDMGNIQTDFEAILASAFPAHRPLISLGRAGELLATHSTTVTTWPINRTWDIPGTGKVESAEKDWVDTFSMLASQAEQFVIVPLNFDGTQREIEILRAHGLFSRCVFVMPPSMTDEQNYAAAWRSVTPLLERAGIDPPAYQSAGRLFFAEDGSWRSLPSFVTAPVPRATALLLVLAHIRRRVRRRLHRSYESAR